MDDNKEDTIMNTVYEENPCGGVGRMRLDHLLGPKELKGKCPLFARVTLPPGAVLGFHEHHGDSECYHILSGAGEYDDNGVKRMVKPGDVTWTPDGTGHSLSNAAGREDLVFIALMIKS